MEGKARGREGDPRNPHPRPPRPRPAGPAACRQRFSTSTAFIFCVLGIGWFDFCGVSPPPFHFSGFFVVGFFCVGFVVCLILLFTFWTFLHFSLFWSLEQVWAS